MFEKSEWKENFTIESFFYSCIWKATERNAVLRAYNFPLAVKTAQSVHAKWAMITEFRRIQSLICCCPQIIIFFFIHYPYSILVLMLKQMTKCGNHVNLSLWVIHAINAKIVGLSGLFNVFISKLEASRHYWLSKIYCMLLVLLVVFVRLFSHTKHEGVEVFKISKVNRLINFYIHLYFVCVCFVYITFNSEKVIRWKSVERSATTTKKVVYKTFHKSRFRRPIWLIINWIFHILF